MQNVNTWIAIEDLNMPEPEGAVEFEADGERWMKAAALTAAGWDGRWQGRPTLLTNGTAAGDDDWIRVRVIDGEPKVVSSWATKWPDLLAALGGFYNLRYRLAATSETPADPHAPTLPAREPLTLEDLGRALATSGLGTKLDAAAEEFAEALRGTDMVRTLAEIGAAKAAQRDQDADRVLSAALGGAGGDAMAGAISTSGPPLVDDGTVPDAPKLAEFNNADEIAESVYGWLRLAGESADQADWEWMAHHHAIAATLSRIYASVVSATAAGPSVAEIAELTRHSMILNQVGWQMAELLGDVPDGGESFVSDPLEQFRRIRQQVTNSHGLTMAAMRRAKKWKRVAGTARKLRDTLDAIGEVLGYEHISHDRLVDQIGAREKERQEHAETFASLITLLELPKETDHLGALAAVRAMIKNGDIATYQRGWRAGARWQKSGVRQATPPPAGPVVPTGDGVTLPPDMRYVPFNDPDTTRAPRGGTDSFRVFDETYRAEPLRHLFVAYDGCDDCAAKPGERHRLAECPDNLRAQRREGGGEE